MRPSIAAALSTLGEVHSASDVLLRPEDAAKFAEAHLNGEVRMDRVIACPSGGLLLVLESGTCPPRTWTPGLHDRSQFALVGAVPKDAWTWADPKKRQPAPPARVNLDARDIHCLTQGGEVHRGATIGTTPTGLVALQAATRPLRPLTFAGIDFRPPMQAFPGFWAAALSIKPADATRTPKDGDTLGSFTPDSLDALPEGSSFVGPDGEAFTKDAGAWRHGPVHASGGSIHYSSSAMLARFPAARTLVLPVTKRTPKDGDRLDSFTVAELDGLPVGARLVSDTATAIKEADGEWLSRDTGLRYTVNGVHAAFKGSRTLVLPKPTASPKVGDRLRDLTPEQRRNLPIGTVLTRTCASKGVVATLAPDPRSGSGAVWLVAYDGRTREVDPECLAEDNVILSLPVSK